MKVCISGAFCTGKTTVFKELLEQEYFDGSVPDLPRSFQQQFPNVDWSHLATRHFNFLYQCLRESQSEAKSTNIIYDGGIHECIGHTRVLSKLEFGLELHEYHKRQYDLVLLCTDELERCGQSELSLQVLERPLTKHHDAVRNLLVAPSLRDSRYKCCRRLSFRLRYDRGDRSGPKVL